MKKLFLSLLLSLFGFYSNACVSISPPDNFCIRFDPITGHQIVRVIWTYGNYTAYSNLYLYVPNPAGGFFGPFTETSTSTVTCGSYPYTYPCYQESYYDIGAYTVPMPFDCQTVYFVSGSFPCHRGEPITFIPDETFDPSAPDQTYEGEPINIAPATMCACGPQPDPLPCSADFIFRSYSFNQNLLDLMPISPNPGSTYQAIWDGTAFGTPYTSYTRMDVTHLYPPPGGASSGVKSVCVGEFRGASLYCSVCMDICLGGPVPATPAYPAPCSLDFYYDIYSSNPLSISVVPMHPNPGSTYEYTFGDVLTTTWSPFGGHTYAAPGTYEVCVREKDAGGNVVCQKCIFVCMSSVRTSRMAAEEQLVSFADEVKLYPNPANSKASLEFSVTQDEAASISVIDMTGKRVLQVFDGMMSKGNQKLDINTSGLATGLYQVRVVLGGNVSVQKLSVVR